MTKMTADDARDRSSLYEEIAAGHGIALAEAGRRLPPSRHGQPVSPATLSRWITCGLAGPDGSRVYLAAARAGGRWVTTAEALRRFMVALTPEQPGAEAAI
jgi:hypothetical protein